MSVRCAIILLLTVVTASCASPATAPAPTSTGPVTTSTPAPAPAIIVTHGNASRRAVALTFDTGDDLGHVTEILDVLRREGVRATFAIRGLWAEQHRDLLLAITAAGHELINATYHGDSFTGASTGAPPLTAEQRARELSRAEVTIYHLSQRSTRPYFRPTKSAVGPYGDVDASVQRDAAAAAFTTIVLWTFDTAAHGPSAEADSAAATIVAAAEPGAIFALHADAASNDAEALARVIDELRAQGYAFATIEEILAP